jgi:cell division septum initiation protein DivIVA
MRENKMPERVTLVAVDFQKSNEKTQGLSDEYVEQVVESIGGLIQDVERHKHAITVLETEIAHQQECLLLLLKKNEEKPWSKEQGVEQVIYLPRCMKRISSSAKDRSRLTEGC